MLGFCPKHYCTLLYYIFDDPSPLYLMISLHTVRIFCIEQKYLPCQQKWLNKILRYFLKKEPQLHPMLVDIDWHTTQSKLPNIDSFLSNFYSAKLTRFLAGNSSNYFLIEL